MSELETGISVSPGLGLLRFAGGGNWTERLPVRFKWLAAA
jgi:hypothetical protein